MHHYHCFIFYCFFFFLRVPKFWKILNLFFYSLFFSLLFFHLSKCVSAAVVVIVTGVASLFLKLLSLFLCFFILAFVVFCLWYSCVNSMSLFWLKCYCYYVLLITIRACCFEGFSRLSVIYLCVSIYYHFLNCLLTWWQLFFTCICASNGYSCFYSPGHL